MFTLTPNLRTVAPARCPICQQTLVASEMWVVDGLCFCYSCARGCTSAALGLEVDASLGCAHLTFTAGSHDALCLYYPRVHGVILYAPPADTPTNLTAAQLHHLSSDPPYTIQASDLDVAGGHLTDLALCVVPQSRPDCQPFRRSTPTVLRSREASRSRDSSGDPVS